MRLGREELKRIIDFTDKMIVCLSRRIRHGDWSNNIDVWEFKHKVNNVSGRAMRAAIHMKGTRKHFFGDSDPREISRCSMYSTTRENSTKSICKVTCPFCIRKLVEDGDYVCKDDR